MNELVVRPRPSLRLLGNEVLMLVWATGALVGSVVAFVVLDDPLARGGLVLLAAYCCFAVWTVQHTLRRKLRVLRVGAPSLRLDDLGVRVRHPLTLRDAAALSWVDCAAAVVSAMPVRAPGMRRYVQFVAVAEDRIEGQPSRHDPRPAALGLSATAAQLAWLELAGQQPGADDVVAWLRRHRPGLRVIGAGDPARQSSEE